MEWLRISTSTELVRVATDEIVYVRADGNYSDLVLTNGQRRKMTFQLHFFDEQLILSGGDLKEPIVFYGQSKADSPQNISLAREGLRQLKELLENEKGSDNG